MKLMLVRHAEPDYALDSLTDKGRVEAEILSRRLCQLDVKAFYVSPLGRARDTASYTLNKLGRSAEVMPWLAEYRGRSYDPFAGHERFPWDYRPHEWQNRPLLWDVNRWTEDELTRTGTTAAIWKETCEGLDALLARHGYVRDGGIYRCEDNRPDTLVFFCHFGISMALIGHLTGISPMVLWQCFSALPSSVTTLVTEERDKGEVFFRCMQLGDLSHLYAAGERPSTAGQYPECYTGRDTTNPAEWDEKKAASPLAAPMTKDQILLGVWAYLDRAWEQNPDRSDEYMYFLGRMNPYVLKGHPTADPAEYVDFRRICDPLLPGDECPIGRGLLYARQFLDAYNALERERFGGNMDEAVAVFSGCTPDAWAALIQQLQQSE